jgi:hypothetical protein
MTSEAKILTLSAELIRLIADRLPYNEAIHLAFSDKRLKNIIWDPREYWYTRAARDLYPYENSRIDLYEKKEMTQNVLAPLFKYYSSIGRNRSLQEIVSLIENGGIMSALGDIEEYLQYGAPRLYRKINSLLENASDLFKKTALSDKDLLVSKTKKLHNLYEQSVKKILPITESDVDIFVEILKGAEGFRQRQKNPPSIIILPEVFINKMIGSSYPFDHFVNEYFYHYLVSRKIKVSKETLIYKNGKRKFDETNLKSFPEIQKEVYRLQKILDDVKRYDIILVGSNTKTFLYVYEQKNTRFLVYGLPYTIPDTVFKLFRKYHIQYNDDLNKLYGTKDIRWKCIIYEGPGGYNFITTTLGSEGDDPDKIRAYTRFEHTIYITSSEPYVEQWGTKIIV